MSIRVTYGNVMTVVTTSLSPEHVEDLIATASLWVDENLEVLGTFSAAALAQIEKYIAAHLVVMSGESGTGQRLEAKRADVSEKYAEDTSRGKDGATSYIRTAAAMDPTGLVKAYWMAGKRLRFRVGGGYNFEGVSG